MAPFIRIIFRYLAAVLITRGLIGQAEADILSADPDFFMAAEIILGAAIAAITELWYWVARKAGWSK